MTEIFSIHASFRAEAEKSMQLLNCSGTVLIDTSILVIAGRRTGDIVSKEKYDKDPDHTWCQEIETAG
jgi:hypothetical protein